MLNPSVIINGIEYRPVVTLPTQSDQMPLCETLLNLRKSSGMSLQAAGDLAGITKSYLWGLEHGIHYCPSLAVAKRIADMYGLSVDMLAAGLAASPDGSKG